MYVFSQHFFLIPISVTTQISFSVPDQIFFLTLHPVLKNVWWFIWNKKYQLQQEQKKIFICTFTLSFSCITFWQPESLIYSRKGLCTSARLPPSLTAMLHHLTAKPFSHFWTQLFLFLSREISLYLKSWRKSFECKPLSPQRGKCTALGIIFLSAGTSGVFL